MKKWIVIIGVGVVILVVAIMLYNTPERQGQREARKISATMESLAEKAALAMIEIDIKQVGLLIHIYAEDHNGQFPNSLRELYPKYIESEELQRIEKEMNYYGAGLNKSAPLDTIICQSQPLRTGKHYILYAGGWVEKILSGPPPPMPGLE